MIIRMVKKQFVGVLKEVYGKEKKEMVRYNNVEHMEKEIKKINDNPSKYGYTITVLHNYQNC